MKKEKSICLGLCQSKKNYSPNHHITFQTELVIFDKSTQQQIFTNIWKLKMHT